MSELMASREAEMALIGALMSGAKDVSINPDDFATKELRDIYTIIKRELHEGKRVDLVTMNEKTGDKATDLLISALNAGLPSMAEYYAVIIRESSIRRQTMQLAATLHRDMKDKSIDIQTAIESAKKRLNDVGGLGWQEWVPAGDVAKSTMNWLEKLTSGEIKPLDSGIPDLDRALGRFYPGELSIIGAKPGTGKTVFGMVMALHASKQGRKVGVMNVEMLDVQYGTRIVSNLGDVESMKLRKGTLDQPDWVKVVQAITELGKLPAVFMFATHYLEDLVSAVRKADLELLVIDYLQRVRTRQKFESERLRVAHISETLKQLAVECRIPVIAMSQLRRPETGIDNKMPSMRDLRESGNLEADADGIILLHEPVNDKDPYINKNDKESLAGWSQKGYRYICMKIEKQRQGQVGTVNVLFDASKMRYIGISRREQ